MAKGGGSRTIATINAKMTTDTTDWGAGLKRASNQVDAFYAGVRSKLNATPFGGAIKGIGQLGSGLAGLGKSAVAPLGGMASALGSIGTVAAGAASAVAGIGLAIGAAGIAGGAAIAALASGGMERIDQLSDSAQRIGVTTDALSQLRYAADLTGSSGEDLDAALEKLNSNMGDLQDKSTPTGAALAKIGIDAKALAKESPDKQFEAIAGALANIPDAATKASASMDIFGKGGVKILNTLSAGSEEIARLRQEAIDLGVSVSQVDAAKIGAAKDALDRAGSAVQGIGNKLATSFAPYIEAAANLLTDMFLSVWDGGKIVDTTLDMMANGFASVIDVATGIGITFQAVFAQIARYIGGGIENVGAFIKALGKVVPGLDGIGQAVVKAGTTVREFGEGQLEAAGKADQAFQMSKPSTAFLAGYDQFKQKARAAAEEVAAGVAKNLEAARGNHDLAGSIRVVVEKLREQLETTGLTSAEAEVYRLKQQGATDAELADVVALSKQIKAKEEAKKKQDELKDFGKSLKEKIKTPLEKFDDEIKKIDQLVSMGELTGAEGIKSKQEAMKDSGLDAKPKFAAALDVRSTEGRSAILAATTGKPDGMKTLENLQKQSLQQQINSARSLETIAKNSSKKAEEVGLNI